MTTESNFTFDNIAGKIENSIGNKEFFRSTSDKWLGGVCAGIADFTGWDVSLVRALTVGAGLVSFGAVVLIYLAAWMIVPTR